MNRAFDWQEDEDKWSGPQHGLRFKRGDETNAGDFKPLVLVDVAKNIMDRVRRIMDIGDNCDSPIEAILGGAVLVYFDRAGTPLALAKTLDSENLPDGLVLVPQFKWAYYRSDWAIYNPKTEAALLIECDGKDFHSSPEQVAHDRKKDQAALDRGYLTMRFTGARINFDADGCAQKIHDAVYGGQ